MKNILFIDEAFINKVGGHENRSKAIYQEYIEHKSKIFTASQDSKANPNFQIKPTKKNSMGNYIFSKKEAKSVLKEINFHKISEVFFRSLRYADLAFKLQNLNKKLKIIIDMDLLSSRLMIQAWNLDKSIKNRYYIQTYIQAKSLEEKAFKSGIAIALSNLEEVNFIKSKYTIKNVYHLPNKIETMSFDSDKSHSKKENIILMYGVMNSTANKTAYSFINNELIGKIEPLLIKYNYKIHIVGRSASKLEEPKSDLIKIIGEVSSIKNEISKSKFVLLPISVASGTNTRVIESVRFGTPVISTELGFEGLLDTPSNTFTYHDTCSLVSIISDHIITKERALKSFTSQSTDLFSTKRQKDFSNKFNVLFDLSLLDIVIHIPRRYTENSWGGTETVISNSAEYLLKFGFKSKIITSKALDSSDKSIVNGTEVERFNYIYPYTSLDKKTRNNFDSIGGNLFSVQLLMKLLFMKKPDIIHLHTGNRLGGTGRFVAKLRNIPYVITLHGGYFDISTELSSQKEKQQTNNGYEWGKLIGAIVGSRKVLADAEKIITLSDNEYFAAKKIYGADRVVFLKNGVNVDKFTHGIGQRAYEAFNINPKKKIILCSARIDRQKNQKLLIDACIDLKRDYDDDFVLVLLGPASDIEYKQELESLIHETGFEKNVISIDNLTPKDELLVDLYSAATVLVLPSIHEPFGLVILESWSANTPVIASNVGGIPQIISNKENGLLFESNNKIQLTSLLHTLLSSNTLVKKLTENAKVEVLKYDWNHVILELSNIYKKIIKENENAK